MNAEQKARIIELFERHRETPSAPYDESRFVDTDGLFGADLEIRLIGTSGLSAADILWP